MVAINQKASIITLMDFEFIMSVINKGLELYIFYIYINIRIFRF